jgi:hypothetical protein
VVELLVLLYFTGPLLLTIATTFATMLVAGRRDSWEGGQVPRLLLVADLAVLALAWVVIATAPDRTSNDAVCKDLNGYDVLCTFSFGSAVVGGAAWGTASLERDSGYLRLIGYAAVALALPYVIAIRAFVATACGWN